MKWIRLENGSGNVQRRLEICWASVANARLFGRDTDCEALCHSTKKISGQGLGFGPVIERSASDSVGLLADEK